MKQDVTLKARLESIVAEMVEGGILFEDARDAFERHFIEAVLERNAGNLSRAAEELRIHRNTLSKRLKPPSRSKSGRKRK